MSGPIMPFGRLPQPSWIELAPPRRANRFEQLPVESFPSNDQPAPAQEGPPPKPVAARKKRVKAFTPSAEEEKEASLEEVFKQAARGRLFKHRARLLAEDAAEGANCVAVVDDGAECNVIDAAFFQSHAYECGWELERAGDAGGVRMANNTVQRLVGFATIRTRVALSEQLVRFRVLDAGEAFQVLLGKPWKAQIGAWHVYEVDQMWYKTSIPGRWGLLRNQNPKSEAKFPSLPDNPGKLAEFLANLQAGDSLTLPEDDTRVLMAEEVRPEEAWEAALRKKSVAADGLLEPSKGPHHLRMEFSGTVPQPDDPSSMFELLKKEVWRRELTKHTREDLFPGSQGSAYLSEKEIEQAIKYLSVHHAQEPLLDFWSSSDPTAPVPDKWEAWRNVRLPELPLEAIFVPSRGAGAKRKIHLYLKPVEEDDDEAKRDTNLWMSEEEDQRTEERERGKEQEEENGKEKKTEEKRDADQRSRAERVAEINQVIQIGDKGQTLTGEQEAQVRALLEQYEDVFAFCLKDVKATDTVVHHIPTPGAVPTRARDRKLNNPDQKKFAQEMADELLAADFIITVLPHQVTWVSSNTVAPKANRSKETYSREEIKKMLEEAIAAEVRKAEGWAEQQFDRLPDAKPTKFRLCHAFLDLNDATVGAPFPVGDLEGKIDRLSGHKYLSCFDMHSGYFAIKIAAEDILKTMFAVEDRGYFAYKRMPFGLKGAPATFCDLIAKAFREELGSIMEGWMDDLATASDDFDSHLSNIEKILTRCREHKLSLNPAKCQLFASNLVWCGTHVSKEGRQPDKSKVQAVAEWPTPSNPHEVLRFLNFAGYYRPLIKGFAKITEPLQRLTKENWKWGEEQQRSWEEIRRALTSFPVLRSPDWSRPFVVETDASILGFGAVLAQDFTYEHSETGEVVTRRHPITYISRGTKGTEKHYPAFLLELVCVKWSFEKLHKYIFGRPIELVTDCQALAGILSLQKVSPAHARWREFILGHDIVKFTH
ncbi:hypothetical protein JCM8097_005454 [Rhodosporidiobolus ruineniae]